MGGFRQFLFRGNLVELAVAVVIGVAFNAMVQSLIKNLITPLIAAAGGEPDFSKLSFTVHGSTFGYGSFINTVVSFLFIGAVVYYFFLIPAERIASMTEKRHQTTERQCPECLSDIPIAARRCKFCTAEVDPAPVSTPEPDSTTLRQRLTWRPRS
jgi:large conductance mechanosensitive channel